MLRVFNKHTPTDRTDWVPQSLAGVSLASHCLQNRQYLMVLRQKANETEKDWRDGKTKDRNH